MSFFLKSEKMTENFKFERLDTKKHKIYDTIIVLNRFSPSFGSVFFEKSQVKILGENDFFFEQRKLAHDVRFKPPAPQKIKYTLL